MVFKTATKEKKMLPSCCTALLKSPLRCF